MTIPRPWLPPPLLLPLLAAVALLSGVAAQTTTALTDTTIKSAVKSYLEDSSNTLNEYGPMEDWDVSSVTDLQGLFQQTSDWELDLSRWNVASVTSLHSLFQGASNVKVHGLEEWNTGQVTTLEFAFAFSTSITVEGASEWDVSQVTSLQSTWERSSGFVGNVTKWNTSLVTTMDRMAADTNADNTEDSTPALFDSGMQLWDWDTSKVQSMRQVFYAASWLNVPLCWDLAAVEPDTSRQFSCLAGLGGMDCACLPRSVENTTTVVKYPPLCPEINADCPTSRADPPCLDVVLDAETRRLKRFGGVGSGTRPSTSGSSWGGGSSRPFGSSGGGTSGRGVFTGASRPYYGTTGLFFLAAYSSSNYNRRNYHRNNDPSAGGTCPGVSAARSVSSLWGLLLTSLATTAIGTFLAC